VLRNDDRWDRSNAVFQDGRVIVYDKRARERDPQMRWIDFGFSVLGRGVVESIPSGVVSDLADVFHELSLRGELAGFEVDTRFFEVGSPDGVEQLESYLEHADLGSRRW
jgi:NDP-sugar pyrophosphorylase family protein